MKGTQRRTIRKEKNNSAGFTLIEMIVTVAIIAIFSGVVVTLITTGSSLFRGRFRKYEISGEGTGNIG